MARPLRLEYPGALWHVTNRGVEKRDIYLDDQDRLRFLKLLQKVIADYRWQLLAYVLMSNHYHLFFRTPDTNLSLGMKDLDGDYASSFNMRHRRVGHLFQGRFKSHLVDSETYLLTLARYIVLNPVRAGMVESPGQWKWSSYRATAGLVAVPVWLDPIPLLDYFNPSDRIVAMQGYRDFVAAGAGQEASPWGDLIAQTFLGGTAFLQEVEKRIRGHKCSDQHRREQRAYRANTIETVRRAIESMGIEDRCPPPAGSDARLLFVLLAERHTNATRAHIGRHLGISGAGVAYLFRIGEARLRTNRAFAALVVDGESRLAIARGKDEQGQV